MRKGLGCVVAAVIALIVLLLVARSWYVGTRNRFVRLDEAVSQQWGQVESQYQRRLDRIPNLVKTVEGAANFEKSTLQAVVDARAKVGQVQVVPGQPGAGASLPNDPNAMAQYAAAQQGLWSAVSRLIALSERHPDLKANQNFLSLPSQLEGTENQLEGEKDLVRLQVGIALGDGDEARDGAPQPLLCRGVLSHGVGIVGQRGPCAGLAGHDLHLPHFGARVDDRLQRRLPEVGGALDGLHEIGDEVEAALVLALDLPPLLADGLVEPDEAGARTDVPASRDEEQHDQRNDGCDDAAEALTHQ